MRQRLATTPYPVLFVLSALVLAPPAFSGVAPPASSRASGSAYVFVAPLGGFAGALTETAKLTAPDGSAEDAFGTSVAVSDNTVVVGAPFDTINTNPLQGSAYVIVAPPGGFGAPLTGQTKLAASDGSAEDAFGFSVAISGRCDPRRYQRADTLLGTPGNDVIIGGGGRDWLLGEGTGTSYRGDPAVTP